MPLRDTESWKGSQTQNQKSVSECKRENTWQNVFFAIGGHENYKVPVIQQHSIVIFLLCSSYTVFLFIFIDLTFVVQLYYQLIIIMNRIMNIFAYIIPEMLFVK